MYAIRCKVKHDTKFSRAIGLSEMEYIIIVDAPKLTHAFDIAKHAIQDKFRALNYKDSQFEFGMAAQNVPGSMQGQLFCILFTGVSN